MSKKLGKTLEGSFTKIARAMSKNYDVNVVASGFRCDTDGKSTIRIPFNADDMKESDQQVLHGMLDHEVAHVVEEREAIEAQARGAKVRTPTEMMIACVNRKEKMMLNVFEDIRIEAKASAKYVGVAENLAVCSKHSVDTFRRRHEAGGLEHSNFWHTFGCGIIMSAQDADISWLPEGFKPYMAAVADEIAASKRSRRVEDCYELARTVIAKVEAMASAAREEAKRREEEKAKEEAEKAAAESEDKDEGGEASEDEADGDPSEGEEGEADEAGDEADDEEDASAEGEADEAGDEADDEEETPEGDGEGDEDGAEDDEAAGGSDEGEGDDEDEGDDSSEGAPTAGESSGDEADGEASAEADDSPLADATDEEVKKAAELADGADEDADKEDLADYTKDEMADKASKDAKEYSRYIPHPDAQAADRWVKPVGDEPRYKVFKEHAQSQIGAMKAKLLTLFRVRAESHHIGDQERGALDNASLYSLRLGNKRVFSTRTKAEEINTAVSIVIDLSGSMGADGKIECATQMAIALGETFSALNIPFEIIGFHNPHHASVKSAPGYTRYMGFEFNVFKAFNESYRATRARLGSIRAGEENVDGEAVLLCAQRLAARPEARKLMFVLSDGEPMGGCPPPAARAHLKEVVKMISNSGIEVFGIGAKTAHVAQYYPNHIVVNSISTLAVEVYKLARKALTKNTERGAA